MDSISTPLGPKLTPQHDNYGYHFSTPTTFSNLDHQIGMLKENGELGMRHPQTHPRWCPTENKTEIVTSFPIISQTKCAHTLGSNVSLTLYGPHNKQLPSIISKPYPITPSLHHHLPQTPHS